MTPQELKQIYEIEAIISTAIQDHSQKWDSHETYSDGIRQHATDIYNILKPPAPKNEAEFLHYSLINLLRLGEDAMKHVYESLKARLPKEYTDPPAQSWVKVEGIRNKLTPIKNLCAMLDEQRDFPFSNDNKIDSLIEKEIQLVKSIVEELSNVNYDMIKVSDVLEWVSKQSIENVVPQEATLNNLKQFLTSKTEK